jgi:hypothetical protein
LAVSSTAISAPLHRIVAVGDLHGDFSAWRDIARAARLVNDTGHWIGGDTVLVQTGDVVDRGPDSLKIIQDLMRLQDEAQRAHGQVIALVGNHEAMNMIGDLRYVSDADYAAYATSRSALVRENVYQANKAALEAAYRQHDPSMTSDAIKQAWFQAFPLGRLEHQVAWNPDGRIGKWVISNPAVLLLDGILFMHGGISPAYLHTSIADMNSQVAAALTAKSTAPEAIINDPMGPLWYRGLATTAVEDPVDTGTGGTPAGNGAPGAAAASPAPPPPPVLPPIEDQVIAVLAAFGAKRIVIAHTPILSGIAELYGGRLYRIDTGISFVYGGKVSYLDIVDGNPVAHAVERSTPLKKPEAQ